MWNFLGPWAEPTVPTTPDATGDDATRAFQIGRVVLLSGELGHTGHFEEGLTQGYEVFTGGRVSDQIELGDIDSDW